MYDKLLIGDNMSKGNTVIGSLIIIIGLTIIVGGIVLIKNEYSKVNNNEYDFEYEAVDFNRLSSDDINKNGYIDVTSNAFKFALYDVDNEGFFYVNDSKHFSVVYMSDEDAKKINDSSKEKSIRIYGCVKQIPSDIKSIGVEVYNDIGFEQEKLKESDFDSKFGSTYLDLVYGPTYELNRVPSLIMVAIGGIILLIGIRNKF